MPPHTVNQTDMRTRGWSHRGPSTFEHTGAWQRGAVTPAVSSIKCTLLLVSNGWFV
jgi:hypothetical protein